MKVTILHTAILCGTVPAVCSFTSPLFGHHRRTFQRWSQEGTDGREDDSAGGNLDGTGMSDSDLEREVKKYKARTEIDAILNDPDGAPFDLESELKKVASGGISPPLPPGSLEEGIEEKVNEIEAEMYQAAEEGDYSTAQLKKNELNQMHIDDCGNVLATNSAFYRAFSNKDYEAMEGLWLHDAGAVCVHPSHPPLIGAKNVLSSWKKMFETGNTGFQRNKMEPTNIRLSVMGTTAIVTNDEEVYTRRFVRGQKRVDTKGGMELVNRLVATNIFRKVDGRWYMVHHHSTWHSDSEAAKKALNSQMGSSKGGKGFDPMNENDIDSVESLLGIPGHEGLSSTKAPGEGKVVKRVFTGSLGDLLGGGLGDILKGDDFGAPKNDNDDHQELIIRSSDFDDDDSDDDDDEEIIIANMVVNDGPMNIGENKSNIITLNDQNRQSEPGKDASDKSDSKDTIRQNCIAALRRLAGQGVISRKQKRMLLTDIITNSAKGEYSLVEVAFDLLCTEGGDDNEAAEEDFAEQCKVFASTLPELPVS